MTLLEISLSVAAVFSSSASQLCMKSASRSKLKMHQQMMLCAGIIGQLFSVLCAVVTLRTLSLSYLITFAAMAYIIVPMGGHLAFGDQLNRQFWLGAGLIILGIIVASH
jgi:undecaprenyl phosphate-alpha-L-ara4N flippase subunit ArnE